MILSRACPSPTRRVASSQVCRLSGPRWFSKRTARSSASADPRASHEKNAAIPHISKPSWSYRSRSGRIVPLPRRARGSPATGSHPRRRRQAPEAPHTPDTEDRADGEKHEDALPPQDRLERGNEPEGEEGQEEAQAGLERQRRSHVARIGQLADGSAELGAVRHHRKSPNE